MPLVVALRGQLPVRVQAGDDSAGQHRELIWIDGAGLLQQGGFDLSDQLRVLIDHPVG